MDYPKARLNSYHVIAEMLDKSIIDSISIEDAHRYNNLNLLDKFKNKKIIFGVLKIASSKIDSENDINESWLDDASVIASYNNNINYFWLPTKYGH